ncbi:hypothetical protein KRZ98_16040 [Sphingobium sp. AS12]|uniref:hypothetical protein n=1 Tax=Sphingobium sp. AS12 TaxID=2849495 RepID=UPI001C31BF63|nr:hypothetical protein [Sphingobium sp. AS12]MBV2149768.1 hypothetical protein [Sphingobium sp. AS12]
MFSTPKSVVFFSRIMLAMVVVAACAGTIGTLGDIGGRLFPKEISTFLLAYATYFLAIISLPFLRRKDIFQASLIFLISLALCKALVSSGHVLQETLLVLLGITAAHLPLKVETLRRHSREAGGELFEVLAIEDRRSRARRSRRRAVPKADRVPRGGLGTVDPRQDRVRVRRPELAG